MTTRLALPILHVSVRLHLVKGRPWSVIEQGLLVTLAGHEMTVSQLAERGGLSHRLVIEALIRLMRAGWAELIEERNEIRFRASAVGAENARLDELPRIAMPASKIGKYVVDRFTGTCFRARDMKIYSASRIEDFVRSGSVVKLEPPGTDVVASQVDAITALLDEDEEIRGFDDVGIRESERYALLTVRGAEIDGLPGNAPDSLRSFLQQAANGAKQTTRSVVSPPVQRDPLGVSEPTDIVASFDDLFVVGGEAHRTVVVEALREAKEWIVIHSTFLNNDAFDILSSEIMAACDRGVRVDILWGQSENSPSRGQTLREIRNLLATLQVPGSGASINISPFSTGSHSKVVLYDSQDDPMIAVVGSCNWLSTQYGSLEVSLRLRDARVVSRIASVVAELARPTSGHWSPLSRDLAGRAVSLRRLSSPTRAGKQRLMSARVLLGGDHNQVVLKARDEAKQRVVFGSHRLGANAKSLAIEPMHAAILAKNVSVEMNFGQVEPDVADVGALCRFSDVEIPRGSIALIESKRRLHAKFMYWDNDDLLVTSQNLLSADPGQSSRLAELGVHLSGHGVAQQFHEAIRTKLT